MYKFEITSERSWTVPYTVLISYIVVLPYFTLNSTTTINMEANFIAFSQKLYQEISVLSLFSKYTLVLGNARETPSFSKIVMIFKLISSLIWINSPQLVVLVKK